MTGEYNLKIKDNHSGESISLNGTFSIEAWSSLKDYLEYADDLLNTKLVVIGLPSTLEINCENEGETIFTTTLPDWNDVTVFLHKFRPIGLKKEKTYFYTVCNTLNRELNHPYIRELIEVYKLVYSGKNMQSKIKIEVGENLINSESFLFDWLNAYEYHRDKDKKQLLQKIDKIFPLEASKAVFIHLLREKVAAIRSLRDVIRIIVGR